MTSNLEDTLASSLVQLRFFSANMPYDQDGFLSVVVITCASHAQGRRFDPGRKQTLYNFLPVSS